MNNEAVFREPLTSRRCCQPGYDTVWPQFTYFYTNISMSALGLRFYFGQIIAVPKNMFTLNFITIDASEIICSQGCRHFNRVL